MFYEFSLGFSTEIGSKLYEGWGGFLGGF